MTDSTKKLFSVFERCAMKSLPFIHASLGWFYMDGSIIHVFTEQSSKALNLLLLYFSWTNQTKVRVGVNKNDAVTRCFLVCSMSTIT